MHAIRKLPWSIWWWYWPKSLHDGLMLGSRWQSMYPYPSWISSELFMGSYLKLNLKNSSSNPNKDGYPSLSNRNETALQPLQSSRVNKCTFPQPFIFAETTSSIFACGGFLSRCNCRKVELDVMLVLVTTEESRLWTGYLGTAFLGQVFQRRLGEIKKVIGGMQRYDLLLPCSGLNFPTTSPFFCKSLQLASDWPFRFQ